MVLFELSTEQTTEPLSLPLRSIFQQSENNSEFGMSTDLHTKVHLDPQEFNNILYLIIIIVLISVVTALQWRALWTQYFKTAH
jgi:hypothetical protein